MFFTRVCQSVTSGSLSLWSHVISGSLCFWSHVISGSLCFWCHASSGVSLTETLWTETSLDREPLDRDLLGQRQRPPHKERVVRILLECILVLNHFINVFRVSGRNRKGNLKLCFNNANKQLLFNPFIDTNVRTMVHHGSQLHKRYTLH